MELITAVVGCDIAPRFNLPSLVLPQSLQGSLYIRRLVGVNSIAIKAIQVILERRGMHIDKVILVLRPHLVFIA